MENENSKSLIWILTIYIVQGIKFLTFNFYRLILLTLWKIIPVIICLLEYSLLALEFLSKHAWVPMIFFEQECEKISTEKKFTKDQLLQMASLVSDWMTLKDIENKFEVSYRQAIKIRDTSTPLPQIHAGG